MDVERRIALLERVRDRALAEAEVAEARAATTRSARVRVLQLAEADGRRKAAGRYQNGIDKMVVS